MNILIVSGFLGAGKTTFIRALAGHAGKEVAVLENEYGDVGIDGDILKKDTPKGTINIWEMTEGCICCSMKGDFASSVLTIANSVDPEYLVIEPTGVGFLSKILDNLKQIEYERIHLLAPVAIVDGHSYMRYAREYPALYQDQIASASVIFISKMEQSDQSEKDNLKHELQKINPGSRIVTEHYSLMTQPDWDRLLSAGYDGKPVVQKKAEELPDTFSLEDSVISSPEKLFMVMEDLIRGYYGDIIRAKGQVMAGQQKLRFDVADGRYTISGADSELKNKVVFIGKNIRRQKLRKNFFRQVKYHMTTGG